MRKVFIIVASMTFASCNNDPSEIDVRNDSPVVIAPDMPREDTVQATIDVSGCYRKILGRDTMLVELKQDGNNISGNMVFDNFEKDGSRGTVHGVAEGPVIKLWYDFQSEGTNSVMEVWFLKGNKKITRGIGSFGVKGDTSYYTNPADIKYEEGQEFGRVKCPK